MSQKTLYDFENESTDDFKSIEKEALKKAVALNDKLIDAKTMLEEISYDWEEFINFLEDERISKYCQFKGIDTIAFNEELLAAIVATLRESLQNVKEEVGYNPKKIKITRAIEGQFYRKFYYI